VRVHACAPASPVVLVIVTPRSCFAPLPAPLGSTTSRFLVGDASGALFVVSVTAEPLEELGVARIDVRPVGGRPPVIPATLAALGDSFVFIGSCFGDSQLVKLVVDSGSSELSIEEVQRFASLAPVVDFDIMASSGRGGQGQVRSWLDSKRTLRPTEHR
jgi:hypothetical protein